MFRHFHGYASLFVNSSKIKKLITVSFQKMSKEITLKAVQADGMYYPPEWRPEMGDLDKFHGGHTLRDKAKKIGQVFLIIMKIGTLENRYT